MFFSVLGENIIALGRWALLFLMISVVKAQWSALNYSHWLSTSGYSEDETVCLNILQFTTGGFMLREAKYFNLFLIAKEILENIK